MCWLKDLVKIRSKLTFASNIILDLEKITYPSMTLKVFKPVAKGNVSDENIKFESDRELVQCRK